MGQFALTNGKKAPRTSPQYPECGLMREQKSSRRDILAFC
jgi:hypothetical protein